jgi:hypothetical protein
LEQRKEVAEMSLVVSAVGHDGWQNDEQSSPRDGLVRQLNRCQENIRKLPTNGSSMERCGAKEELKRQQTLERSLQSKIAEYDRTHSANSPGSRLWGWVKKAR